MANTPDREGKRYKFRDQFFWAWNGRIAVENQQTGAFKTMSRAAFVARAIGFNDAIQQAWDQFYPDERDEMARLIQAMCDCNRECRAMGDPDKPEEMSQVAKDNRPIQVCMSDTRPTKLPRIMTSPKTFLMNGGAAVLESPKFKSIAL